MVFHTGPHIDNETLGVPHLAFYFVAHLSLPPSSRNRLPARSFLLCWPGPQSAQTFALGQSKGVPIMVASGVPKFGHPG